MTKSKNCVKFYIGKTGKHLGDKLQEHPLDIERNDKKVSKVVVSFWLIVWLTDWWTGGLTNQLTDWLVVRLTYQLTFDCVSDRLTVWFTWPTAKKVPNWLTYTCIDLIQMDILLFINSLISNCLFVLIWFCRIPDWYTRGHWCTFCNITWA